MFEVGKRYEFEMLDNVDKSTSLFKAEVLAAEGSLIRLLHDDEEEEILNANSMLFVRAKEIEPEAALLEELAAKEIGASEPDPTEAL
jgi:hypothetical protein